MQGEMKANQGSVLAPVSLARPSPRQFRFVTPAFWDHAAACGLFLL